MPVNLLIAPDTTRPVMFYGTSNVKSSAHTITAGTAASMTPLFTSTTGAISGTLYADSTSVSLFYGTGTNITRSIMEPNHNYYIQTVDANQAIKQAMSMMMKSNLLIKIKSRSDTIHQNINHAELRARDTLRDMLTEQAWRRYLTNGFIMVKGPSGLWYQIHSNYKRVQVYNNGEKTHSICIHTVNECPPSDHVINMKLLIEFDEEMIWKQGNVLDYKKGSLIFNDSINIVYQSKNKPNLASYLRTVKQEVNHFVNNQANTGRQAIAVYNPAESFALAC